MKKLILSLGSVSMLAIIPLSVMSCNSNSSTKKDIFYITHKSSGRKIIFNWDSVVTFRSEATLGSNLGIGFLITTTDGKIHEYSSTTWELIV